MNQKDYLVTASNNERYNIRLCQIIATGSESASYDRLYIIYKTPADEYIKRVKHFHPMAGRPEVTYEVISAQEALTYQNQKFSL